MQPRKGTSVHGSTSYDVKIVKISPLVTNKKTKNPNSSKLGIRPDHPRRRIEIRFCMVGVLWVLVHRFKFDQNRLSGFGDFMAHNVGSCITFANGLYNPVLPYMCDT